MEAKTYFEVNKEKIRKTAEFLCRDDVTKTDEKFEELKNQYLNEEGTNHKEVIVVNEHELNINQWLEEIRHNEIEHFKIIAITDKGNGILYETTGTQFSSYGNNLDVIDSYALNFIKTNHVSEMLLYIVHNHPFIYKASPSVADLQTLEAILKETDIIEAKAALFGMSCKVSIIDYAIATEFDYWCIKQEDE